MSTCARASIKHWKKTKQLSRRNAIFNNNINITFKVSKYKSDEIRVHQQLKEPSPCSHDSQYLFHTVATGTSRGQFHLTSRIQQQTKLLDF